MRLHPFKRIENSLEFIVERPFAMFFRRSIQPAEVGKRLKRELTSGSVVSVRGKVAPNEFVVLLSPDDFGPYDEHGRILAGDLEDWLEDVALQSNVTTAGPIHVQFEADESVRRGRFEVRTAVAEHTAMHIQFTDPGRTEPFEAMSRSEAATVGFIEICSGPTTGAVFPIRKQLVTVGRDLSNDLVIDSAEVSRFHAEIQASGQGVFVSDSNSLNGTFVNGIQVVGAQRIGAGDQIMFGTTLCRYWYEL
ncbi:MAG: DUF3662 domain-containing protein [Thermomicrobiales bacterium]|nr:DUF3662 domain-containing protein [Thermomicrobiales bacterium]MCO5221232.1 DUF3662 domain-containing protein [Thermomicrobiales bacterium]